MNADIVKCLCLAHGDLISLWSFWDVYPLQPFTDLYESDFSEVLQQCNTEGLGDIICLKMQSKENWNTEGV